MDGSLTPSLPPSAACVFVYLEANKRAKGSPTAEMLASVSSVSVSIDREFSTRGVNIYKEHVSVPFLRFSFEYSSNSQNNIASRVGAKLQGLVIRSWLRNFLSKLTFVRMNASHSSRRNCPRGEDDDAELVRELRGLTLSFAMRMRYDDDDQDERTPPPCHCGGRASCLEISLRRMKRRFKAAPCSLQRTSVTVTAVIVTIAYSDRKDDDMEAFKGQKDIVT